MSFDQDAERSVVGGLMLNPSPADVSVVLAELAPEAFSTPALATVFVGVRELHEAGVLAADIDEVRVRQHLVERGLLQAAGGSVAIADLTGSTPTSANVVYYSRLVRKHWQRRRLRAAADEAKRLAEDPRADIGDSLDRVASAVSEIVVDGPRTNTHALKDLVRAEFKEIQRAYEAAEAETGLATGLPDLDGLLGGLQRGDLIIVAGRPSMGKTSLAMGWLKHAGVRLQKRVQGVSLEMGARSLARRMISEDSGVDAARLRRPKTLSDLDWPRLAASLGRLDTDTVEIVDQRRVTVADIRAHARIAKARKGLDMLLVDYLQLVKPVERGHSREREVAEISDAMKGIALELDIPVVVLSQLNRENEKRSDKRPMLSDLRDSGAVEQDADVVVFVHRPHVYDQKIDESEAELIVAKHRNGETGIIRAHWDGKRTRFAGRAP